LRSVWIALIITACLLAILVSVLLWILLVKITLIINSDEELYCITIGRVVRAQLLPRDEQLLLRVKVLLKTFETDLLAQRPERKKKRKKPKLKRKGKRKGNGWQPFRGKGFLELMEMVFQFLRAVIRAFRVEQCQIHLDTGDAALNGRLIPVVEALNYYTGAQMRINFQEHNSVRLIINHRLGRLVIPVIRLIIRMR